MNKTPIFIAPKYWTTWFNIALLRLAALLPFRLGLVVGSGLGWLLYHIIPKRRRVTEVNVGLCFPEMSAAEKKIFVKDTFRQNAIGIIEAAWSYWGKKDWFAQHVEFIGFEHLEAALSQEKGVILLGAHYSHLDLGGLLVSLHGRKTVTMYRPHNNPLLEHMMYKGRSRFCIPVDRKKLRDVLRHLRNNQIVWYGPDQDFGAKHSVFAPFFGQTAATLTATTKMVQLNNSPMVALYPRRKPDNSGYIVEIVPVDNFPTGDITEDAIYINKIIETGIRRAPTQYMWMHKRFKTQPDGKQKLYKQMGC